jgi:long-chain acyl-CoA synthetase
MTNLAATGGVPGPGRIGRVAIGDLLNARRRAFPIEPPSPMARGA